MQPITSIQNLLPKKEVSIASSQLFFWQYLGGATFLAIGETVFTNTLRSSLESYAPGVDPRDVIDVGASAVRSSVSKAELPGVLRAYNHALVATFVSFSHEILWKRWLADSAVVYCCRCGVRSFPNQLWNGVREAAQEGEVAETKRWRSLRSSNSQDLL
jgi:hypothetical protein